MVKPKEGSRIATRVTGFGTETNVGWGSVRQVGGLGHAEAGSSGTQLHGLRSASERLRAGCQGGRAWLSKDLNTQNTKIKWVG